MNKTSVLSLILNSPSPSFVANFISNLFFPEYIVLFYSETFPNHFTSSVLLFSTHFYAEFRCVPYSKTYFIILCFSISFLSAVFKAVTVLMAFIFWPTKLTSLPYINIWLGKFVPIIPLITLLLIKTTWNNNIKKTMKLKSYTSGYKVKKINLSLCLINYEARKMHGGTEIQFYALIRGTRQNEWTASYTLYSRGKNPRHPLDRMLGRSQSQRWKQ